ncbi:MAG TPA: tetratricopeptide repeat protein [Polyangiaceae bacterium]
MRSVVSAMVVLALLAEAPASRAADADRERDRAALYKEGVNLAAAGNWSAAVERFRRVVELRASPKALYTLGEAEEHAGQLAEARRSYRASLDAARAAHEGDVVDLAGQALGKVESRVPQITVRLDAATAAHGGDTHADIDGHPVPIGAATDVDPGDHEVRVEATGAGPFVRSVHAAEGQQQDVAASLEWRAVAPEPSPREAPPAPAAAASGARPSPLVPIVVGGIGVAVAVTGLVVRLNGQSDYDGAAGHCTSGVCPSASIAGAGNDARGRIILGTTLVGVGAAVGVGGAVYWLLSRHSSSTVQAGAAVDGSGARAVLRGAF